MTAIKYRLRAPETLVSVDDYRLAARRKLPAMIWAYVDGGAEDLVSLADNRRSFGAWSIRQNVLTGYDQREMATTVAGVSLDLPVLLAPTGFTGLTHWRGDVAAARAAHRCGTRYVLSTSSSWSPEEVSSAVPAAPFFQLYPTGSEDLVAAAMARAWDAGYRVLFVTVDVPTRANRGGERKRGMGVPPVLTPRRILDAARRPRWSYEFIRHRRISAGTSVADHGVKVALQAIEEQSRNMMSTLNWNDIAWMRERWKGSLFLKGILDPSDAERAVDVGADGVVVSNHGGRQLDYAVAPLHALPDVVAAVRGRIEVLMDGGVRRGSDVLKALALGARAVLIGRPYLYGLAVRGEEGAVAVIDLLRDELRRTMTLAGIRSVHDVGPSALIPRLEPPRGGWPAEAVDLEGSRARSVR